MTPHNALRALEAFASRMARTDDPRQHQDAGRKLQRDLQRIADEREKSPRSGQS